MKQTQYGPQIDLDSVPPCPVTGYRYGHAWLVEAPTDEAQREIAELFGLVASDA